MDAIVDAQSPTRSPTPVPSATASQTLARYRRSAIKTQAGMAPVVVVPAPTLPQETRRSPMPPRPASTSSLPLWQLPARAPTNPSDDVYGLRLSEDAYLARAVGTFVLVMVVGLTLLAFALQT